MQVLAWIPSACDSLPLSFCFVHSASIFLE